MVQTSSKGQDGNDIDDVGGDIQNKLTSFKTVKKKSKFNQNGIASKETPLSKRLHPSLSNARKIYGKRHFIRSGHSIVLPVEAGDLPSPRP